MEKIQKRAEMQSDIHRHRVQMVCIILMCCVDVLAHYVCSCNGGIVWFAQINENERKHREEVERDRQLLKKRMIQDQKV